MKNKKLFKIILTGLFAAIAIILAFLEIPYFIPWLQFDISEVVILLSVSVLGFIPMVFIALIKSIAHLFGGTVTPYNIGEVTAFIAALSFGISFYFLKFKNIILRLVLTILIFTSVMTICNYLFITPIYLGKFWFTQVDDFSWLSSSLVNLPFVSNDLQIDSYSLTIILLYLPFNLFKGIAVSIIYYLVYPQVLKISSKYK